MMTPKTWGQGALFAFSGLDGKTDYEQQLVGSLLGDHAGVHFYGKRPFELYIATERINDLRWSAVTGDLIEGFLRFGGENHPLALAFAENATVVGRCPAGRLRLFFADGESMTATGESSRDGVTLTLTVNRVENADYFCVSLEGDTDASAERVSAVLNARRGFYEAMKAPEIADAATAEAFAKAVSVMKTQVYSPEGRFGQFWTTPDRLPHKALWLWDSVFHSFGNHLISEDLAKDTLRSVLDTQLSDGFIPHMGLPAGQSNVTQPPVLAWGVQKLVERTGDDAFAAECFDRLAAYLNWDRANRQSKNGLFFWYIERTSSICRCAESGMDNCSRFDDVEEMDCIDFSCFMLRDAEALVALANRLGRREDAAEWSAFAEALRQNIITRLWDEEDGFFYDRVLADGSFHKVRSVASFLPFLAGACTPAQKEALLRHLDDPEEFSTLFGVAGIAINEESFGTDMWRGPVWINYNYMVAEGLYRMGETERADALIRSTVQELTFWYKSDGVFYEFYDSLGIRSPRLLERKGPPVVPYQFEVRYQSIRDYGWTSTLFAAMIAEHPQLFR